MLRTRLRLEGRFSAAHFYNQPAWSEDKNREEFGRCFTSYGHGHDYRLQIEAEAPLDEVRLRADLKAVCDEYDHLHLNFMTTEFAREIPTTEVIAGKLWKKLEDRGWGSSLKILRLYEREDLFAELTA